MANTSNFLILTTLLTLSTCVPDENYHYPPPQQSFQHSSGSHQAPSNQQTASAPQIQQSIGNYLPPNPGFSHSAPGADLTQTFRDHQHGPIQPPIQNQQGGFSQFQSPPQPGGFNIEHSFSSQNPQGFNPGPNFLQGSQFSVGNHQAGLNSGHNLPQVQLPGSQFSVGNHQGELNSVQNLPQGQRPNSQFSIGNHQADLNPGQNIPLVQLPGLQFSVGNEHSGFNPGQNIAQVQFSGSQFSAGNHQAGLNLGQNLPQGERPNLQFPIGNHEGVFNPGQNIPQNQLPGPQYPVQNHQAGFNPGQNHHPQIQLQPNQQTGLNPGHKLPLSPQNQGSLNFPPQNPQLFHPQGSLGQAQPQGPLVTKHVYIHVAPEEPQAQAASLPLSPPKQHYKIIFIKAPAQQSTQKQLIQAAAAQQRVEEKTLIYVLVDKTKQPEIVIPTAAPTVPSKPEVYFVKYKANNGAGAGQLGEGSKRPENSGESTSSLFSGGLGGPSSSYGPPGYAKRSA